MEESKGGMHETEKEWRRIMTSDGTPASSFAGV